jgi:glycosyltransferase involved in cell wall biosynthesis
MRVLWITNTIFPAACKELGLPVPVVGGWMYSSAKYLLDTYPEVQLGVASLYKGNNLKILNIEGIKYYLLPSPRKLYRYEKNLETYWTEVRKQFEPDVIHIHGSEYPHGLAYINACGNKNTVVSIQGLVSIYERNYYGGISEKELSINLTLRDIVRRDSLFKQRKLMQKRAIFEKKLIQNINHVIGRTFWDKTHAWVINPDSNYHFCNETLREEFYKYRWNYESCEKHTIFLSQAHYPIKGLHQMIKALPLVLRKYPDTKVYVAGNNFFSSRKSWKLNGFGKYIQNLIKNYKLEDNIIFTGILSEKEMCSRYLISNVFICPSSIENSPNSVGEAQLLGVPCIVSHVGGAPEMVINEQSGLVYRFEEFELLAANVVRIFEDKKLAKHLSENGRKEAHIRHSQKMNIEKLNSIYSGICKEQ